MTKERTKHKVSVLPDVDPSSIELTPSELAGSIPILPLRQEVAMPRMMMPLTIGRPSSLRLVRDAQRTGKAIGLFTQMNDNDVPLEGEIELVGVSAKVVRVLDLPDGTHTALVQCFGRIKLESYEIGTPYITGTVSDYPFAADLLAEEEEAFYVLGTVIDERAKGYVSYGEPEEGLAQMALDGAVPAGDGHYLINFLAETMPFSIEQKMKLLDAPTLSARGMMVLKLVNECIHLEEVRSEIEQRTHDELDDQQREYFLQHELKVIHEELGDASPLRDADELRLKAQELPLPETVREQIGTEISRMDRMQPQSPDYNVALTYVQTVLGLPWGKSSRDNGNLSSAERTLNRDHYGLEKVKERIMEHLAVLKLRGDMRAPILCLYGPPGVGKTSLGKSIARALKRECVRASLGGVHDEAEIRGHRRTYVGAMPGRIIKGLLKAGVDNPVFILDEIDKTGSRTANGDPQSALLEVLDPEQNNAFHDNYLDVDFDLSKVMFIATANDLSALPSALLDRMELIEVSGYCTEEKLEIAKRHLLPKAREANGLRERKDVTLRREAMEYLIEHYTRESGVRGLEKRLNQLMRKTALAIAKDEATDVGITKERIVELLGKEPYNRDSYQGNDIVGVVTGLAWTSVGGEILFIETSLSAGKDAKLTLTGNLGDVMKESAMLAMEYVKAHADELGVDSEKLAKHNVHIHVPEGATPKDGPSAGVTMTTSLVSALTGRRVRRGVAMTGEITLRGKVLPVGGIKEKMLAARRAGITDVILCGENRRDVEEIPEMYVKGLTFHYAETIKEVLDYALL